MIGTHRLLQKDVQFKDLGMAIIDEEQRFGVEHKEFFKRLRKSVDVLTLTATPIPRTLHMAMLGLRDISNLVTPPRNRLRDHHHARARQRRFVAPRDAARTGRAAGKFSLSTRASTTSKLFRDRLCRARPRSAFRHRPRAARTPTILKP